MDRSSGAYDESVARVMAEEDASLAVHEGEVMSTGFTTITEPTGTFQMTLWRPRWRSGALITEGRRGDGRRTSGWTLVPRRSNSDFVARDVVYRLAQGVVFLRQE